MRAGRFAGAVAPLALLAAAVWLAIRAAPTGELQALLPNAAPLALAVAAALGLAFHRGRIVFAAAALAVAYFAWKRWVEPGPAEFAARSVFAGIAILLPAVLAAIAWMHERATLTVHAVPRLAVIGAAAGLVAWIVTSGRTVTTRWAYAPLTHVATPFATPIPQLGLLAIAAGLAAIAAASIVHRSAVVGGIGWALAAFALGLHFSDQPAGLAPFAAAAGLILVAALLQETYRLAFRDQLTGLPSRRALDERLSAVGRRYAIAMVDVDHFKSFNDTHGHDVGDQVLRMVAARLARVGGGGTAFRYGGEEFAVLFPGRELDAVLPHLEALRADIEAYRMTIRGSDRPKKQRAGKRRRTGKPGPRTVSVTVSIGAAERDERRDRPEAVIKAADKALYRAKREGRNRLAA